MHCCPISTLCGYKVVHWLNLHPVKLISDVSGRAEGFLVQGWNCSWTSWTRFELVLLSIPYPCLAPRCGIPYQQKGRRLGACTLGMPGLLKPHSPRCKLLGYMPCSGGLSSLTGALTTLSRKPSKGHVTLKAPLADSSPQRGMCLQTNPQITSNPTAPPHQLTTLPLPLKHCCWYQLLHFLVHRLLARLLFLGLAEHNDAVPCV